MELSKLKQELMDLDRQKVKELHSEYGIDRVELSKIIVIASTTVMILSIHSALSFQDSYEKIGEANEGLGEANGILKNPNFQGSLDQLDDRDGLSISRQIDTLVGSLDGLEKSVEETAKAEENLERNFRTYQWLALIGILGNIAGVSIFYIY